MIDIHRKDYPSYSEYNKARMKYYNHKKHMEQRLNRFDELVRLIREYEKDIEDDSFIALKLASECEYKLVKDKDLT